MPHPSTSAPGHGPYGFCISKAVPGETQTLEMVAGRGMLCFREHSPRRARRESPSEQRGRRWMSAERDARSAQESRRGPVLLLVDLTDGQDCLFQEAHEEPTLHSQHPLLTGAACSLSRNHHGQPAQALLLSEPRAPLTPMHTHGVKRERTIAHLNSTLGFIFLPSVTGQTLHWL